MFLKYYFLIIFNIFLIDKFFVQKLIIIDKAKYYFLHALFNLWVICLTFNESIECLLKPLESFDSKDDFNFIITTIGISSFHTYHILTCYQKLNFEDWMHHLISSSLVPFIAINNTFKKLGCLCNFIMCGLPGFIDYLLLTLVKYNKIEKLTEKRINTYLNMIIRYPFMIICFYIYILLLYYNKIKFNYLMLGASLMHLYNGFYYSVKVVANYHLYLNKK